MRIARQSDTALRLAEELERHPAVARVRYPGLPSHPQHDLAKRQMAFGGSILAVDLAGGLEAGRRFVEGVRLAQMASSLGGPETLVNSPANSTHAGLSPDELEAAGIGPGLVRISVGLEHVDDLLADFDAGPRRLSGSGRQRRRGSSPRADFAGTRRAIILSCRRAGRRRSGTGHRWCG